MDVRGRHQSGELQSPTAVISVNNVKLLFYIYNFVIFQLFY